MSTKEKLIKRFLRQPKDFTWEEFMRLFGIFGFSVNNKGKTSGSRVLFEKDDISYVVHKPHPSNFIKEWSMKDAMEFLTEKELLTKNNNKDNEQTEL